MVLTSIDILMPALSPTMTVGNLVRWLKVEGDQITSGDVIAEIETDKSIVELEAIDDGVLGQILVPDGTADVPVNQRIATITKQRSEVSGSTLPFPSTMSTSSRATPSTEAATPALPAASTPAPETAGGVMPVQRVMSSPLARRIAGEKGIDLTRVLGSGPRGRVIRADVEGAQQGAGDVRPQPAESIVPSPDGQRPEAQGGAPYTEVPVSRVRKTVARRLTEAKATIPHFYLTIDCNVGALLKWRSDLNARSDTYKLSVNDFIVRAAALALRKVPSLNASWHESVIRMYSDVDVAVAVATPKGLITPVIRKADRKGIVTISNEIKVLSQRAREGKLNPSEYEGGGFTVSNLGMYGIREFVAIINPPQASILALGATEKRVIVVDEVPTVADMMTCTLSTDHRVADGITGAEFLSAFRKLIEDPIPILIDLA